MNTENQKHEDDLEQEVEVYVRVTLSLSANMDKQEIADYILECLHEGFSHHEDFVFLNIIKILEEAQIYGFE